MISIIVPVYKVEPYLHQCVDSILNQTYRDLEIILIDDGSPDRCGEICDEYARKDNRVRVLHTENRGLSAARNLGLREATGDYIGFVDSDDWIEPDMYEVLLTRLEETGADISVCGLWYEHPNRTKEAGKLPDIVYIGNEALIMVLSNGQQNCVWNKLYCSELWESILFPDGRVYEDVATTYKAILKAKKVVSTSICLYHYRQRTESIGKTRSMKNLIDYWSAFYERQKDISALPGVEERIQRILLEQVANAAAKTWRWIHKVPKEQWDQEYLNNVSKFVRDHYPLFGKAEWPLYLKVSIFITRKQSDISFAILYYLNQIHRIICNRET